jgi:hypothetical protein
MFKCITFADIIISEAYSISRRGEQLARQQSEQTLSLSSVQHSTNLAGTSNSRVPPDAKKKSTLFTYRQQRPSESHSQQNQLVETPRVSVLKYLELLDDTQNIITWESLRNDESMNKIYGLFEKIFCVPASSAPVERVFSHSGLFLRPHRAKMGDKALCELTYIKCNKHLHGV